MKIPVTLKHKPVIVSDNYEEIDGRYAGNTDAKGLSIGLAQWNDRGKVDVSAKIWRYTGEKWSRQSEEMPLHRVLDLAILICRMKQYLKEEAYQYEKLYDEKNPQIDRIGLQGCAMTVAVCEDNPMLEEDMKLVSEVMSKDDEMMSERLYALGQLLKEMGYVRS